MRCFALTAKSKPQAPVRCAREALPTKSYCRQHQKKVDSGDLRGFRMWNSHMGELAKPVTSK